MDTKDDGGLEQVSPASKMALCGSCVHFRGCRFACPCEPLTTIACQAEIGIIPILFTKKWIYLANSRGDSMPTNHIGIFEKALDPALNWASLMISLDPLCLFYLV